MQSPAIELRTDENDAGRIERLVTAIVVVPDAIERCTVFAMPGIAIARIVANQAVMSCSSVGGDIDVIVEVRIADVESLNRLRDEIAGYPHVVDLTTTIILKREKEAVASMTALAASTER